MLYVMICRQYRHEQKRFWFCQERVFGMPVSEKQIMPETEGIHPDTWSYPDTHGLLRSRFPDRRKRFFCWGKEGKRNGLSGH